MCFRIARKQKGVADAMIEAPLRLGNANVILPQRPRECTPRSRLVYYERDLPAAAPVARAGQHAALAWPWWAAASAGQAPQDGGAA